MVLRPRLGRSAGLVAPKLRLYSYVVRYDVGFAPNPFHGWCTLATCMLRIRAKANVGDWIIGTGSAEHHRAGYLVYAMRVDEVLSFDEYWADQRFVRKRPSLRSSIKMAYGDNIYHRDVEGKWLQENSRHSTHDGTPNPDHIARDTKVDRVLISQQFVYYGGRGPAIPKHLRSDYQIDLVPRGRSYRVNYPPELRAAALRWITSELGEGYQGDPFDWDLPVARRRSP